MSKTNIIASVLSLLLGITFCIVYFYKKIETDVEYISVYDMPNEIITQPKSNPGLELAKRINKRNSNISTLKNNFILKAKMKGSPQVRLNATLAFQKDKNLRMRTFSRIYKESDIGSNEEIFWFWSKRMKKPYIYYGDHKTGSIRLKPAFDPIWLMECCAISEIDLENSFVTKYNNQYAVIKKSGNVVKMMLLSEEKESVIGCYLYDKNAVLIASTEYVKFNKVDGYWMPKEVKVILHNEGAYMYWYINETILNDDFIRPNMFEMPSGKSERLRSS